MTLALLLTRADACLGSRKAVMAALKISRQRLYSAATDGPPLRAERLVRLALITGEDACEALRAGRQFALADLLDEAYRTRFAETTPDDRRLVRAYRQLPAPIQPLVVDLLVSLAEGRSSEDDGIR